MERESESLVEVTLLSGDKQITTQLFPAEIEQISEDADKYLTLFKRLEEQTNTCLGNATTTIHGPKSSEKPVTNRHQTQSQDQNSNRSGAFRWTTESIKLLLDFRLSMEDKFNLHTCKKIKLWQQILTSMLEVGNYVISANDCYAKYRNILQTYRHNKEKRMKTTGESKIVWEFFEIFVQVLGSKASTVPPAEILSTSVSCLDSPKSLRSPESEDSISEDGTSSKSKKNIKKKKVNELSVGQYLYYKKNKNDSKWEEQKELKVKEIEAINNLADAIRSTAPSAVAGCSGIQKVTKKSMSKRKKISDSESD